jgi:predicted nucleic-acid-binding protein
MAALDTNVLVRYLVKDNEAQFAQVKKLVTQVLQSGATLYVPVTVILELEWVLRSNFDKTKLQVIEALTTLLSAAELSFASESAIEEAVHLYKNHNADFADCVHIALSHVAGESPLWTFDKAASKVNGGKILN